LAETLGLAVSSARVAIRTLIVSSGFRAAALGVESQFERAIILFFDMFDDRRRSRAMIEIEARARMEFLR
jgi:hypothetical protein